LDKIVFWMDIEVNIETSPSTVEYLEGIRMGRIDSFQKLEQWIGFLEVNEMERNLE
jgi:hypothetical protein